MEIRFAASFQKLYTPDTVAQDHPQSSLFTAEHITSFYLNKNSPVSENDAEEVNESQRGSGTVSDEFT